MPRLNVDISTELSQKLKKYIIKRWGSSEETLYGRVSEVVREALEEFLSRELVEEG